MLAGQYVNAIFEEKKVLQKEHMEYESQVFGRILETLESKERTELLSLIKKILKNFV